MAKRGPKEFAEIKEGGDPFKVLKDAFVFGRQGGSDRDYTWPEEEPDRKVQAPDMDEYRASFAERKNSSVSDPPDESANQFRAGAAEHLNDTPRNWTRGMSGQSPHPTFDNRDGVVSGARYSGVRHRR